MKFFAAVKSAEFAAKISAAAGFDLETALKSGDQNALKAFIDAKVAAAGKPSTDAAAEISTLETELEGAEQINATLTGSLEAAGIKFPAAAADATAAQQIAANKAAIDAHIKIRSQGVLAQTGHTALTEVVGAPDKTAKTISRTSFFALTPREQLAFSKNGGRITD